MNTFIHVSFHSSSPITLSETTETVFPLILEKRIWDDGKQSISAELHQHVKASWTDQSELVSECRWDPGQRIGWKKNIPVIVRVRDENLAVGYQRDFHTPFRTLTDVVSNRAGPGSRTQKYSKKKIHYQNKTGFLTKTKKKIKHLDLKREFENHKLKENTVLSGSRILKSRAAKEMKGEDSRVLSERLTASIAWSFKSPLFPWS